MDFKAPKRFSDAEQLILEHASTRSGGLTDFGPAHFMTGLRMILCSMDVDPRFTEAGRQLAWDTIVLALMGRLFTAQGLREYPEAKNSKVVAPLVIMGLPRTGTTVLHKLLSMDAQFQGLQNWLTICPTPRPPREQWESHPYFKISFEFLRSFYRSIPEFRAVHNIVPDEVDECLEVLRQGFVSNRWASTWTAHSYDAWWLTQDETPSYYDYADTLRVIGHRQTEKRWLLKNPQHLITLKQLFEVFPDACVIQTHRDPRRAIPSMCSTVQYLRKIFEGEQGTRSSLLLGHREMEKWALAQESSMPIREKHQKQMFDVDLRDFHRDPMSVVRRIYDFFKLTLTPQTEAAMRARIAADPERSHGEHHYNIADFGLREGELFERYRDYIGRFDISDPPALH